MAVFEISTPRGLDSLHQNSPSSQKYLIETMGGGVALLDYNNDGLLDIFFVNSGKPTDPMKIPERFDRSNPRYWNRLYRQNTDGTFSDVTEAAGLSMAGDANYGMGVAAADYDNDGYTNLYVTNYGKNILYHNNGNGTFSDVANDGMEQFLFHNNGNGTFTEKALDSGVALSDDGKPYAGMAVDFRDYDNDGRPDLIVTDLARQIYAVYHNDGNGQFSYHSLESGIGAMSAGSSGWGVRFEDFDNNGWKDLFVAQSHVMDNVEQIDPSLHYRERPLFALNHDGHFERSDPGSRRAVAGRGAAFGDLNNDGWLDVVTSNLGDHPSVFRNRGGRDHWLTIVLRGTRSNRDGFGARVDVNGQTQFAGSGGSYLSASDKRVHFGLGSATDANVDLLWPSGKRQALHAVAADKFLDIREPQGR